MNDIARLHDVSRPGIMISQTWPASGQTEGATLAAIEKALELEYFTAFQTVEVPFPAERKKIAAALEGLSHDYCLARVLNRNKLNLSSLDPALREKSCLKVIECLDEARETGARIVSFVGGSRPRAGDRAASADELRSEALKHLGDSLARICEAALKTPALDVHIEPLDFEAHKMGTLGRIPEAVDLCRSLNGRMGLPLFINVDTAHAFLNGEDPAAAMEQARANDTARFVREFHFCNCVIDPEHEFFGDLHLPFGAPGLLGVPEISKMMQQLLGAGFLNEGDKPILLCEVLKRDQDDSLELMHMAAETFKESWNLVAKS